MRKTILHRLFLLFLSAGLFLLVVYPLQKPGVALGRAPQRADGYQVMTLVNQVRASYGLPALQANSALMAAAQGHSEYQASIGSITHSGAGGSSPDSRAAAAGYGGGGKIYISENIYGGNNATPSQAVGWWQSDPPHLQTMINPNATDAGAGVAEGGKTVYYTLDVGYVAGAPGSGSLVTPVSSGTKAPTVPPVIPIQTATPAADGTVVHVVQPGQALWNIAAAYNVSIADLMALNGLTENSFIYPGDKILVRKGTAGQPSVAWTPTITISQGIVPPTPTNTLDPLAGQVQAYVPRTTVPNTSVVPTATVEEQKNSGLAAAGLRNDPMKWLIFGLFGLGVVLILMGSLMGQRG
jgi:uncharacterized protein YkwD